MLFWPKTFGDRRHYFDGTPTDARVVNRGLARGGEDRRPKLALEIDLSPALTGHRDRHMDIRMVPGADHHVGPARHAGVDRPTGQVVAKELIGDRGRHAADDVAGIDVLEVDRPAASGEVVEDLLAEPLADVVEADIARCVDARGAA